jgi:chromosome condensin MukBEF MukE localization factor
MLSSRSGEIMCSNYLKFSPQRVEKKVFFGEKNIQNVILLIFEDRKDLILIPF